MVNVQDMTVAVRRGEVGVTSIHGWRQIARPVSGVVLVACAIALALPASAGSDRGASTAGPAEIPFNGSSLEPVGERGINLLDVEPRNLGDPLGKAALADIAFIAQNTGEVPAAAIARLGWQEDFAILVSSLRDIYPDQIAGAKIEKDDDPWISFRDEVPREAMASIVEFDNIVFSQKIYTLPNGSPYSVEVRSHAGYSENELDLRMNEIYYELIDKSEFISTATAGYDQESGEIRMVIQPTVEYADEDVDEFKSILSRMGVNLEGVAIDIVRSTGAHDDTIYGGQSMTSCTSGFAVQLNGGTRGMSTAAHCSNTQTQGGYTLTFKGEHNGTWGDFQWHTSTGIEADDFYAGGTSTWATDLRDVGARGNAVNGRTLCRNGKTSYKHCDSVYELNHCSQGACHLTAMEHDLADPGDSGGPWYWGNTAYGLHKGNRWWGFAYRDLFSPQQYIDDGIAGLSIATS